MELKKNPALELSRKRGLFFSIGLCISLSLTLIAFEYRTSGDSDLMELGNVRAEFDEMIEIPPTEQPPPMPKQVIQIATFVEVPDEQEIEDELEVELDVEITEETVIEEFVFAEAPEEEEADEIFTIVEHKPSFPGGDNAMYEYLSKQLNYPTAARRMGVQGRVFVQFVVSQDGSITNVEAVKGIGSGCDEEAERVVKNMPKWAPGKQRGKAVKVRLIIPVFFKLA